MQIDIFKEILVPVVGGLGIFMLGLEFMSDGINHLAANRMRAKQVGSDLLVNWPAGEGYKGSSGVARAPTHPQDRGRATLAALTS